MSNSGINWPWTDEEIDEFHHMDWIKVPNASYIVKYKFNLFGYRILVSNLTSLYYGESSRQKTWLKFVESNPHIHNMSITNMLNMIQEAFQKYLAGEHYMDLDLISDKKLVFSLEFEIGFTTCKYAIETNLTEGEKFAGFVISPIIFNSMLAEKKISEMQKKISAFESTKSLLATSDSTSVLIKPESNRSINPDLLKRKNASGENLLESFLKLQSFFKALQAENFEAYKKEESKRGDSSESPSKKFKAEERPDDESNNTKFEDDDEKQSIEEGPDDESNNIRFEDDDEKQSTEEEEAICHDNLSSRMKSNAKKKSTFKI